MEIKKILVPVDFSENSQKILGSAGDIAGQFGQPPKRRFDDF